MPRAKNATRIGARERQHHEPPYTHRGHKSAARGKRRPRTSHTHYQHTAGALRRPAREKRTARARLNLNATARTGQGPRTRHQLRLAGAVPFPLLTGGSAAPLSTATLLSTLEIGLGPSAARPLRRGAGRPTPNTISSGGGLAEGNGSAFNWLSRARRAPSDFPSPVAPPPSCELVATRGRETRERSAGAGLALASQELDSRSTPPGLGSCGCVGR